jgi:hypothetical protein
MKQYTGMSEAGSVATTTERIPILVQAKSTKQAHIPLSKPKHRHQDVAETERHFFQTAPNSEKPNDVTSFAIARAPRKSKHPNPTLWNNRRGGTQHEQVQTQPNSFHSHSMTQRLSPGATMAPSI